ncbi:hypothetical protein BS47DRAFT_424899 [Hydnum rufescens UP504]|uniref:BZIP domain-containing protein n=1 Tax=Hydnum rufescens UP504 TaxID=1448309 RepID=A0A9P6B598_9AGAM|nr:hypothetical protein BS47DRAFT_424899 [Hydnum rufescens UP504]
MSNLFGNLDDIPLYSSGLPSSPPLTDGHSPTSLSSSASPYSAVIPSFGHPSFAIDPQLVATTSPNSLPRPPVPAPASAAPRQPETNRQAIRQTSNQPLSEDDDEDDDDDLASVSPSVTAVSSAGKVTAKGRKSTSNIVQSGGVSKRVTSAVVAIDKDPDSDDWRPSPEEYKKLSSKEKRQLRNKISARNFRVRRKEYITTLESHIADRDRLIEAIREELGASKLENDELRQEVDALKRAMLEGRTSPESLALPPPAPLDSNGELISNSPIPPTLSATATGRRLNKPNTRKDIAPGSPHSGRGFWGGATGPLGGVTPVHATLIPDFAFPTAPNSPQSVAPLLSSGILSGKPQARNSISSATLPSAYGEQDNINPLLNLPMFASSNTQSHQTPSPGLPMSRFDSFMDLNPFTIKSVDDYRMHLWAQMAREAGARQQQQQQTVPRFQQHATNPASSSASGNNLLSALRPAFFSTSSSSSPAGPPSPSSPKSTLAALLSGKAGSSKNAHSYPSPPPPPPQSLGRLAPQNLLPSAFSPSSSQTQPTSQQAYMAALASHTLLSRMGTAFWDAFSANSCAPLRSGAGASHMRGWDADKVRRVLEGTAVVRVVDVDQPTGGLREREIVNSALPSADASADLEEQFKGLSLGLSPNGSTSMTASERCGTSIACSKIFSGLRKSS